MIKQFMIYLHHGVLLGQDLGKILPEGRDSHHQDSSQNQCHQTSHICNNLYKIEINYQGKIQHKRTNKRSKAVPYFQVVVERLHSSVPVQPVFIPKQGPTSKLVVIPGLLLSKKNFYLQSHPLNPTPQRVRRLEKRKKYTTQQVIPQPYEIICTHTFKLK